MYHILDEYWYWYCMIYFDASDRVTDSINFLGRPCLQLSEEGPCEDLSGDSNLSSFNEWMLPAKEFDGMWERLILIEFLLFKFHNSDTEIVIYSCAA